MINGDRLADALDTALRAYRLLDHPFYRRWSEGGVSPGELRDYAAQYRHFEAMLPSHLAAVAATPGPVREAALTNLADEAGGPVTHVQLFEQFAGALGAPVATPSGAMSALMDVYSACVADGPVPGFAAVLAYERQAAEVSASKAAGLREHHILDDDHALAFWDVHAGVDADHASWALNALADAAGDADEVVAPAARAARAWWAFLDEREALRPVA